MANVKYGEYLKLGQLLGAQEPISGKSGHGQVAHDEMLFIITHQAYELWFRQILHELHSIVAVFGEGVLDDKKTGMVNSRLERIVTIQRVLVHQMDIMETMTPLDFMEFRDLLVPASGFQSIQFKQIEIILGLKSENRIRADREFFRSRLSQAEQDLLQELESQPSLRERVENWLSRIPFLEFADFDFWTEYRLAVQQMFSDERNIIATNASLSDREREFQLGALDRTQSEFELLLDRQSAEAFKKATGFQMEQRAVLAALFIQLYRDEPILYLPFKLLTNLVEIDELWTTWRQRHAIMVQRMLGKRIGTGGSAGHQYLKETTDANRFFFDLFNLSSWLIPRSRLPRLPDRVRRQLGFHFQSGPPN